MQLLGLTPGTKGQASPTRCNGSCASTIALPHGDLGKIGLFTAWRNVVLRILGVNTRQVSSGSECNYILHSLICQKMVRISPQLYKQKFADIFESKYLLQVMIRPGIFMQIIFNNVRDKKKNIEMLMMQISVGMKNIYKQFEPHAVSTLLSSAHTPTSHFCTTEDSSAHLLSMPAFPND